MLAQVRGNIDHYGTYLAEHQDSLPLASCCRWMPNALADMKKPM
jgi:hypothetical protein